MTKTVISVENLNKEYNLGVINTGRLVADLNKWWARWHGKPDPYAKVGRPDHLNRRGESILALNDVSFVVKQGEALGIIGANGAGKSTLLKILSQVTAPTSGRIRIKGRVGSLLEVGTGFHPELTGRENIYLNGAILGMMKSEVDRKFEEIVDFSGVEQFIDTPVKRYSSGMTVRLGFAVAAHLDPEILIVDEVLAVGDAEFRKKCLGKMSDVTEEGRTVLFVSHNMMAIKTLCPRTILLSQGQVLTSGNTNEVIDLYFSQNNPDLNVQDVLGDLKNRKGTGDARLMNVRFPDHQEVTIPFVNLGEPLTIEMELQASKRVTISQIRISIYDKWNNRVASLFGDDLSDFGFTLNQNESKTVVCKVLNPNLAPGVYSLAFVFKDDLKTNVDKIDQGIHFEVVPSDYFGTGKFNPRNDMLVLRSEWSLI